MVDRIYGSIKSDRTRRIIRDCDYLERTLRSDGSRRTGDNQWSAMKKNAKGYPDVVGSVPDKTIQALVKKGLIETDLTDRVDWSDLRTEYAYKRHCVTLSEARLNGPRLPPRIVEHREVHKYRIDCQWESADKGCTASFILEARGPLSDADVIDAASEAGYMLVDGHVECGCHRCED